MNDSTKTLLDPETVSTILKWAVTILIAGFIAQFGKKFANYLTDKIRGLRKNRKGSDPGLNGESGTLSTSDASLEKARLKIEKKKAKSEAKKNKKTE
ncbi:MAG: hypothetical protein JW807_00375 [Spirochaetes bacterium]|nr:hypothetical protein [Spirochaetota bacterium]